MKTETLYYDGQCPLCSSEVRRLATLSDKHLACIDVHSVDLDTAEKTAMLKVLHYHAANGEWLTGLDANIAAWQHTKFGFMFRWLRWPFIRSLADKVYSAWATTRYDRLYRDRPTRPPFL